MRTMLKPVSTLLIALSLALGTVAVASAQDSGEPAPVEIGLFCPNPACPADACGPWNNTACVRVLGLFGIWKCKCLVVNA